MIFKECAGDSRDEKTECRRNGNLSADFNRSIKEQGSSQFNKAGAGDSKSR